MASLSCAMDCPYDGSAPVVLKAHAIALRPGLSPRQGPDAPSWRVHRMNWTLLSGHLHRQAAFRMANAAPGDFSAQGAHKIGAPIG